MKLAISLPMEELQTFCQHWQIQELAVFGSILRDDFRLDTSDVDFLAVFEPSCRWSLLDRVRMESDLEKLLDRPVDLLDREEIEQSPNWLRRQTILKSARIIYAA
ncbi:nucleotidyltransferase family protein [Crocosphaera sp. XPORK-15E]|uniref:nucleotidyltransferase family protein n=1 Tax=Crocosphaera sp. XPORK-15E TaxID=3110247 RepID=UPI002B2075F2|nr:nucleotidyltransferase domain-containing protein [Crocosphaera sp. XPORK-15E]MEA5536370.1 nucleotidyltransferase domain-containing protein [Crocosphaera sp. XPORK-15E]